MTSILKYAVLAISVTLTATLQAKSINDSSQVQKLSKSQIECLSKFYKPQTLTQEYEHE